MPNPIKPSVKTELLSVLLLVAAAAASFYFYARFPERVPIHWNMAGEPDNWGSRGMAAFLFPGIMAGMYALFLVLPYLDPKKDRYVEFRRIYHIFKNIIMALMTAIYFITGLNAIGFDIPVSLWVPGSVGILFIVIGNYLGKIKPNWFMGIRTPWTLSSEEVWNKTHRFGGRVFIAGGILMVIMGWLPPAWRGPLFAVIIIVILSGTVGYSYVLYAREQGHKRGRS